MTKLLLTLIITALSFMQGYVPGGMAFNPITCTPHLCPTSTPEPQRNRPAVEFTSEPTPEPTQEPTIEPTQEPTVDPTELPPTETPTPEPTDLPPTDTPTPEPTEEPEPEWVCPATGDSTKQEYKRLCMDACKDFGLTGCGKICKSCWED